jgi:hypothetical protein
MGQGEQTVDKVRGVGGKILSPFRNPELNKEYHDDQGLTSLRRHFETNLGNSMKCISKASVSWNLSSSS